MREKERDMELILASGSPRRRELMALITQDYTVITSDVDESEITADTPAHLAQSLATAKAEADKIIEAARAEGERERKKIVDDANREAVAIAEAAMDKLVNEHTSAAYDDFLKTVEGESK